MEVTEIDEIHTGHVSTPYSVTDLIQTGKRLGTGTRLQVGHVYSTDLAGNRLRRSETILVRDLEFLRIYDNRSGRVTASYPDSVPYFHACAPHCLVVKQSDGSKQRLVWQAIASQLPQHRHSSEKSASAALAASRCVEGKWLRCISEDVRDGITSGPGKQKANSAETIGDVSCLESLVLDGKVFLLAAYKNGMLAAYTQDLTIASSPITDSMMGERIKLMISIDPKRAANGILKSVSNLQAAFNGTRLLAIISQLANPDEAPRIRLRILQFSIVPSEPDKPVAVVLLSQDISLDQPMKGEFGCMLHEQGLIYFWAHKTIQIFDVSRDLSQPYRTLQLRENIASVLRLDQHSIAVCTTKSFDRINLQFNSSQGKFDWPEPLRPSDITKEYGSKLIEYDQKLGRLLCLYDSKVISISANGKTPTTIADFVDRGLQQTSVTVKYQLSAYQAYLSQNPRGDTMWDEWIEHMLSLADCVRNNDKQEFDIIFGKLLSFITSSPVTEEFESVSLSPSQRLNNEEKLSIIICYMFEPVYDYENESKHMQVTLKILPERTFNWLVKNGYLTANNLQHSFRRMGKISSQSIAEEAVIQALASYQTDIASLKYYITHNNALTAAEAAVAISFAINSTHEPAIIDSLAIESGHEMDVDRTSETGEHGDALELSANEVVDQNKSELLQVSLLRLVDKDHLAMIKALREHLTNQQLFGLIEYLRMEMSRQGWFVEVLRDTAYSQTDANEKQNTITRLAKILGCVLDALGMAPWLNTATSAENENLISWMKLEVSAALEAVEESSYLSGILHEVSLFTKLLSFTDKERSSPSSQRAAPRIVPSLQMGNNALPPGLKPAGWLDVNVIQGGKIQKMSARQIGHMKSKMVGAYSREKIDLNDFYEPPMHQNGKRKR